MAIKIFYSWQSDLPNNTNRGFIETALNNVAKSINADVESADREIEIDTATKNVIGTVNIADTILKKIDECDVFIADVSIVGKIEPHNKGQGKLRRKTPNPNVLFELGYAWKRLGEEKIISVMNIAYGKFEELPFDLRGKTVISYYVAKDVEEKATERRNLEKNLGNAIRLIINSNLQNPPVNNFQTIEALNTPSEPSQAERVKSHLEYKKFRQGWLSSETGVSDTETAVSDIFNSLEDIYNEKKELYLSSGISFHREIIGSSPHFWLTFQTSLYFRLSWSKQSLNSVAETKLRVVLAKDRKFENVIQEDFYKSDIDENSNVIWYHERSPKQKYTSSDLARSCFRYFMNRVEEEIYQEG